MSALTEARDHALKMVNTCNQHAANLRRQLDPAERAAVAATYNEPYHYAEDPKALESIRAQAERQEKDALLWSQIADEIDYHLHRTSQPTPGTRDLFDLIEEGSHLHHGPDLFLDDGGA